MLFSVDGAIDRVVVIAVAVAGAAPHGEYSTSNVGSVVAYGVGVDTMAGRAIGDVGGDFGNGRFLLGVTVVVEFEFFGVKLRKSRSAYSILPNDCGVLDTLPRYEYGCGVCKC